MTPRTLSDLAELCQATLTNGGDRAVIGPASLAEATRDEISFLADARYTAQLETTGAGAVIVGEGVATGRDDLPLLVCKNPGRAFTQVILEFAPPVPEPLPGVHRAACVDPSAELAEGVSIGPHCTVGEGARIAEGAVLHSNVSVGAGTSVGAQTVIHPGVVLYPNVSIGARCLIHGGAVIGADGFGFEPTSDGWSKIPQCGTVAIEDDVEIGANVTIDRARFGATRIGRGTKIDNLVHVAHNVQVGEASMFVAQVGIAGSTKIGRRVILAGQVGVGGHLKIGAGSRVAGGAGVFRDIPADEDYFGFPAMPKADAMRNTLRVTQLDKLNRRVRELEQRVRDLLGEAQR